MGRSDVEAPGQAARRGAGRTGIVIVLAAACLYYLQFGIQALDYYLQFGLQAMDLFIPQGLLSVLAAAALAWAGIRAARRRPASSIAFWGTMPVLLLHLGMTFEDSGELPFLLGSAPVPLVAGVAWLVMRRSRAAVEGAGSA